MLGVHRQQASLSVVPSGICLDSVHLTCYDNPRVLGPSPVPLFFRAVFSHSCLHTRSVMCLAMRPFPSIPAPRRAVVPPRLPSSSVLSSPSAISLRPLRGLVCTPTAVISPAPARTGAHVLSFKYSGRASSDGLLGLDCLRAAVQSLLWLGSWRKFLPSLAYVLLPVPSHPTLEQRLMRRQSLVSIWPTCSPTVVWTCPRLSEMLKARAVNRARVCAPFGLFELVLVLCLLPPGGFAVSILPSPLP